LKTLGLALAAAKRAGYDLDTAWAIALASIRRFDAAAATALRA
jgi:hypothetical protein